MNKARREMVRHIWEQYEAAKVGLDKEMFVRSQEMILEWAKENGYGEMIEDQEELEKMHSALENDEEMVEKSNALAEEVKNKFWTLIFDHVVPAIDESKVACKDGIIIPTASESYSVSSAPDGDGKIIMP